MKLRMASLTILCLVLAAPAWAQVLYDDGPINGTNDAWTINFGFVVGDTFTLLNNSTVGGFNFGVWEYPGDVLTSVQWSVTQYFDSGTVWLRRGQRQELDRPVHLQQPVRVRR